MSTGAISSALIHSIRAGAYPDAEDVVSSEITTKPLNATLDLVKQEQGALKVC